MFCQATAVLVALAASFALELTNSRLLLCQDGAIAAATSLDLLVVGRLITLGQAAGRRRVAGLADGTKSSAGRDGSAGSVGLVDVDGLGDCLGRGGSTQGGAFTAGDTVSGIVRGTKHRRSVVRARVRVA
jgi:hypothetical protein